MLWLLCVFNLDPLRLWARSLFSHWSELHAPFCNTFIYFLTPCHKNRSLIFHVFFQIFKCMQTRNTVLQHTILWYHPVLQLCVYVFLCRLQEKVQETIEALRLAGIKVWVLTGDKHETAVSVSLSCGHFHRTMNILELVQQKSDHECAEQLRRLARR